MDDYYLKIVENFVHILILLGVISGTGVWLYCSIKNKAKTDASVPPILFFIHSIIFVILSSFNAISKEVYIIWRDLIFLHAITIFLTAGILEIKKIGGK